MQQHAALDTTASAAERYNELLRCQPPHERLGQAVALSRAVRELAIAGIRQRNPGASEREIQLQLAELLYGAEAACRISDAPRPG